MPPDTNACKLCGSLEPLELSHIVPAFFFKYLKATSATGHIRSRENPDLRIQDGPKIPLLCRQCEQSFSKLESAFKGKYFNQLQHNSFRSLKYDSDLYSFAISIAWRILALHKDQFIGENPQHASLIETTFHQWRQFLLGKHRSNRSAVHLFVFAGAPISAPLGMPKKALHYMLRAVDITLYHGTLGFGIYAKLIRSAFFIPINPSDIKRMANTRIHIGGGTIVSPQAIDNVSIAGLIRSQMIEAFKVSPSETQLAKMEDALLKNPERAMASETFRVHKAGLDLGL